MGRRPGISSTEKAFRQALAKTLRNAIGDEWGAAARAADELRISRQAISLYLKEKTTPSAEIMRRICQRWNLTLNIEGNIVSESSYSSHQSSPIMAPPLQLSLLPDAIDSLRDEDVRVKIVRKIGDSIDLEVKIDFKR
jgi:transcriptional regulator with XRE-family HTH domain